jgi:hypothetical protein
MIFPERETTIGGLGVVVSRVIGVSTSFRNSTSDPSD